MDTEVQWKKTFDDHAHYQNEYQQSCYTQNGYFERKRIYQILLDKHLTQSDRKNVLDIGCGTGNYFDIFSKRQMNIHGLDFSSIQLAIAQKKYPQAYLYSEDFFKFTSKTQFDLVSAIGVLQTVDNPMDFFLKLTSHISTNGMCIISFLNDQSIFPTWLRSPALRFYSLKQVAQYASAAGLCIVTTQRIYVAPKLPGIISKILSKLQPRWLNHAYMLVLKKEAHHARHH